MFARMDIPLHPCVSPLACSNLSYFPYFFGSPIDMSSYLCHYDTNDLAPCEDEMRND